MPDFHTPEPISVTIELTLGDVHVIATERDDTVVAVNPFDPRRDADVEAADKTRIEHDGDRLAVRAPSPSGLGRLIGPTSRSGWVSVIVELPSGSNVYGENSPGCVRSFRGDGRLGDVRIEAAVGDIRLDQTRTLHATTSSGGVIVDRVAGDARIKAAGEISIGAIDGKAEVKNLNGRTRLGWVTGALGVKSSNGDIVVDRAEAHVDAKTASGSIRIGDVARGSIVLATSVGGIDVGVHDGTAAWIDARTQFGRVTNALEAADSPGPARETVEIRARTSSGDIVIQRA